MFDLNKLLRIECHSKSMPSCARYKLYKLTDIWKFLWHLLW